MDKEKKMFKNANIILYPKVKILTFSLKKILLL